MLPCRVTIHPQATPSMRFHDFSPSLVTSTPKHPLSDVTPQTPPTPNALTHTPPPHNDTHTHKNTHTHKHTHTHTNTHKQTKTYTDKHTHTHTHTHAHAHSH